MTDLIQRILDLSPDIRYAAIYRHGALSTASRPDLTAASSSESDKYEELIVNPTLLKLLTQRGDIDCGGMAYVVIRYGNFFQYVAPLQDGHVSVALEPSAAPLSLGPRILAVVAGL